MSVLRRRRQARQAGSAELDPLLDHASEADREIVRRALPHTMIGAARLLAVIDAVRYCTARGIEGAFAECGVWRGGSVLAMILTLQELATGERDLYLYDTFVGMPAPSERDVSHEERALEQWSAARDAGERAWPEVFGAEVFNEDGVRSLLSATAYPMPRLHFVRGRVEETVPGQAPDRLALLRLDTDWYESTRHELRHLFPRLSVGGVLIIDDYGHWQGAREAVDEYFSAEHPPLLLARTDYTGRIAIKQ